MDLIYIMEDDMNNFFQSDFVQTILVGIASGLLTIVAIAATSEAMYRWRTRSDKRRMDRFFKR